MILSPRKSTWVNQVSVAWESFFRIRQYFRIHLLDDSWSRHGNLGWRGIFSGDSYSGLPTVVWFQPLGFQLVVWLRRPKYSYNFFPCWFFFFEQKPQPISLVVNSASYQSYDLYEKISNLKLIFVSKLDLNMWLSVCIFCIFRLYKKGARVAFPSFLKAILMPTPRNLPTTSDYQLWVPVWL